MARYRVLAGFLRSSKPKTASFFGGVPGEKFKGFIGSAIMIARERKVSIQISND